MRLRKPSPAMLVASLALFVALGGSSYAALKLPKASVGAKQLKKNSVTSPKVKPGSLLLSDFRKSQRSLLQGPQGAQGQQGSQGPKGDTGAAATRLWASVDNDATPSILYSSGVTAVAPGGFTGALLVSFDRDVSQCSFQATVLGHGGGSLNPTVTVGITTGFYAGSGMGSNQVRVQTYFDGARAERDFDVAAFC